MRLKDAALLADENIHPDIVAYLRVEGFDVLAVREAGLRGTDDLTLLRRALAESRVIVTHDSDFGTLAVAAMEPIFAVVYLRPGHIRPEFTVATLRTLLENYQEFTPPCLVVAQRSGDTVRVRVRVLSASP